MPKKPEPPKHLSDESKKIWLDQVTSNVKRPRLKLFETALEYLDEANEMRSQIEREGRTLTTKKTGAVHKHPLIEHEARAREQFTKLWKILHLNFRNLDY